MNSTYLYESAKIFSRGFNIKKVIKALNLEPANTIR